MPGRSGAIMFRAMKPKTPHIDPELQRLFEASFDDELRRCVHEYLDREGVSRTRFGRMVLGDPGLVDNRLNGGGAVKIDTADRIRVFVGAMPFRQLLCWELEVFLSTTGLRPWAVGYQSVRQPAFVDRLRAGASPYVSTVDRIRGWMRRQTSAAQRRDILATVAEAVSNPAVGAPGPAAHAANAQAPDGGAMNGRPRLLTTTEAAAWLGLSPRTLEIYRVRGLGPRYCKLGRWVRYLESDLREWLEERKQRSTSENGGAAKEAAR